MKVIECGNVSKGFREDSLKILRKVSRDYIGPELGVICEDFSDVYNISKAEIVEFLNRHPDIKTDLLPSDIHVTPFNIVYAVFYEPRYSYPVKIAYILVYTCEKVANREIFEKGKTAEDFLNESYEMMKKVLVKKNPPSGMFV